MRSTARLAVSTVVVGAATATFAVLPTLADLVTSPSVDDGFVIDRFDREITLGPDGRSEVVETIDVTFVEERRGIVRDLDTDVLGGGTAEIAVGGVVDEDGDPWPYTVEEDDGEVTVRVGEEDVQLAPGPQTYRVGYRTTGQVAIDESDPTVAELRIDVPGDGWPTTVAATTLTLDLPAAPEEVTCVYGAGGATTACPPATVDGERVTQEVPALEVATTGTVAVRLPAEAFTANLPIASFTPLVTSSDDPEEPAPLEVPDPLAGLLLGLAVALPIGGLELVRARLVYRDRVTDPLLHDRATPTAELAPPDDLAPNELAAVVQRLGDQQDRFLATLVDLELRGVLRSETTTEDDVAPVPDHLDDVEVERIVLRPGPHPERAEATEAAFVDALLGDGGEVVLDGEYDEDVAARVAAATDVLDTRVGELRAPGGDIVHDGASWLRGISGALLTSVAVAVALALGFGVAALTGLPVGLPAIALFVAVAAWVALAFTWRYQRQAFTSYGRDLSARTRAFRHFLTEVHRDRLAFAAERGTDLHHPAVALLPYAVALGLADSWYDRFAPVLAELAATDPALAGSAAAVPWWAYAGGFSGLQAAQSGSTTDPSSSSGGAVGGGAGSGVGGGGGGSW